MFFWKKRPKWHGRTIYWRKSHNGYGMEVSIETIIDELKNDKVPFSIELSRSDKTIFLNIRFGELYHHCNDLEWGDILKLFNLTEEEK